MDNGYEHDYDFDAPRGFDAMSDEEIDAMAALYSAEAPSAAEPPVPAAQVEQQAAAPANEPRAPQVTFPAAFVRTPFASTYPHSGNPVVSKSGNQLYQAFVSVPPNTNCNGVDISHREIRVDYAWGEKQKADRDSRIAAGNVVTFELPVDRDGMVYLRAMTDRDGNKIAEALKIDAWEVAKAIKQSREAFAGRDRDEMIIPSAFIRNPFPAKNRETGQPIVSKSGNQLYKAFVSIPPNTKCDGTDLSNREILVDYAWGESRKAVMDGMRASKEPMSVRLPLDKDGLVYIQPQTDRDGNRIAEAMRVDPKQLSSGVAASIAEYAKQRKQQREVPAQPVPAAAIPVPPAPAQAAPSIAR